MSTVASTAPVTAARLPSLTSLRWFAASLVFLSHVQVNLVHDDTWFRRIGDQGSAGVSFFFMLSGFVLVWSHQSSTTPSVFYRRRFARIYPAYALVAVASIPVLFLLDEIHEPLHLIEAVLPLTLLQAWIPHYRVTYGGNGVSWSLSCEAFFYATFPFIVGPITRAGRNAQLALLAGCAAAPWVFALAARPAGDTSLRYLVIYTNPAARIFEFVIGIVLGALLRSGFRLAWLRVGPAVAVTMAVYVAAGWVPLAYKAIPLTVIPFALLIFAAAQADIAGTTPRLLAAPALITLGQWSYCFYLVHQMVLRVLGSDDNLSTTTIAVFAVVAYVVATGLAGLLYTYVEHPLERRLRPAAPTASAPAHLAEPS